MTPKQRYKAKVKELVRLSNLAEESGLPPDPWVVAYREKNNAVKAGWKSKQPKKEPKKRVYTKPRVKTGPKLSPEQRDESRKRSLERVRKWHKDNRERVNRNRRERRQSDPSFRIAGNLRKRLSFLLKQSIVSKTEQTLDLLGCTLPELMTHLESQFQIGMTFQNYGDWHIDHKTPCDSFDLTLEVNRRKCFHFSNLQPLWATENRRKSNRICTSN